MQERGERMGLFSKRDAPAATTELTPIDAVAGIALCAVHADGVLDAEEWEELGVNLERMPLFATMSEDDLRRTLQRMDERIRTEGEAAFLQAASEAVPDTLRATAYYLAADLTLADADIGADERAFLDKVQTALGVSDETAGRIVDVLRIKNTTE